MQVEVTSRRALLFDDGSPVRAASAIAPFAGGWLIAQDDATHAGWWRSRSIAPLRLFPPVDGHDLFSDAMGTKHLKPDLEAACDASIDGLPAALLLGSGSTPARMRAALTRLDGEVAAAVDADLSPFYHAVAGALGLDVGLLNLEGACRLGPVVRLFNRGNLRAGLHSGSVDVDLASLVAAVAGRLEPERVPLSRPLWYELGEVGDVGLAITDAVALPDGRVLASAAAEDTPNAVDDGPVVAAALVVLAGGDVQAIALVPTEDEPPHKIEGLALRHATGDGASLLAVVDADDAEAPSLALDLTVRWH